jgi:membrane protein
MNPKELVAVSKATFGELGRDDVSMLAAALTYYSFFSLFPLILLAIIVAGLLVKPEDASNFIFTQVAAVAPGSTALMSDAMDKAFQNRNNAGWLALIGVVTLAFSASNAFSTLYKAVNRAWNTEHRPSIVMDKVISFAMMAAAAVIALASLLSSAILTSIRAFTQSRIGKVPGEQVFFQFLSLGVSLVLVFLVLLLMYRFLPRTYVRLKDVWLGAALAAVAWTLTKELFSVFLGSSLQNYDAIYGTVGAVIVLLTWIYISSLIILTGAEFASETNRYRRLNSPVEKSQSKKTGTETSPWF